MVKIELIEINRKALSIQNKLITKKKYKTSGEWGGFELGLILIGWILNDF